MPGGSGRGVQSCSFFPPLAHRGRSGLVISLWLIFQLQIEDNKGQDIPADKLAVLYLKSRVLKNFAPGAANDNPLNGLLLKLAEPVAHRFLSCTG